MSSLPQRPAPSGGSSSSRPDLHAPSMYPQGPYRQDSYPSVLNEYRPSYDAYPPPQPYQAPPPSEPPQSSSSGNGKKKRARATQPESATPPSTSRANGRGKAAAEVKPDLPAVLVREKKQKACANCRRAKLKCIVEDGEADCVRCKARKEKCVFYPRSHDEDWQQILTQDVYNAMSHISQLSSAVHHLLSELTSRNLIAPYQGEGGMGLDRYTAPERDMAVMQGWSAERNKELDRPGGKRRRKRDDDDDDDEGESPSKLDDSFIAPQGSNLPGFTRQDSLNVERYPQQEWQPAGAQMYSDPRYAQTDLAPFRSQNQLGPIQLTPNSELDISQQQYGSQPTISPPLNTNRQMLPPGTSISPSRELQGITPNSLPHSSPIQQYDSFAAQQMIAPLARSSSGIDPALQHTFNKSIPLDSKLGAADTRRDVIVMNIVSPRDAVVLVNYSHENLCTYMYGYRLEFGRFPYLPQGPEHITPLILGVLCILAAERISSMNYLYGSLAVEVRKMLLESPAESWQTLALSKAAQEAEESQIIEYGAEYLDPELAIGPEEIVAAAIMSMYMGDREQASKFAEVAFSWARGWIKMLSGPPRNSVAELSGIVPEERKATPEEMARVWLLCYLAEGTIAVAEGVNADVGRDPEPHCQQLVLDPPNQEADVYDLILTYHARLLFIFRTWSHKASNTLTYSPMQTRARDLQRITAATDNDINHIRDLMQSSPIPFDLPSAQQLVLFSLYVRASIYTRLIELAQLPARQRAVSVATMVDIGMEMLEKCTNWVPPNGIANLPQPYLIMITVVVHTIHAFVSDSASSKEPTGCPVTPSQVYPLLEQLGRALGTATVNEGHNALKTSASTLRLANGLRQLAERAR